MSVQVTSVQKKSDPTKEIAMEMGKSFAMSKLQGMGQSAPKQPLELEIGKGEQVMTNPRDRRMAMGVA